MKNLKIPSYCVVLLPRSDYGKVIRSGGYIGRERYGENKFHYSEAFDRVV